jgi:tripartite ATP-independent transporter DctP family solute receptor
VQSVTFNGTVICDNSNVYPRDIYEGGKEMRTNKRKLGVIVLLASSLWLSFSVAQGFAAELRFAHTMSTADTFHLAAIKFSELVKQKTNGTVDIKVYPAGQLGQDQQVLQGVRIGSIDIAAAGVPWYSSFAPWMGVLNLPYIFKSYEQAYRVLDGDIGRDLGARLEPLGMKVLGYPELGFRNVTTSKVDIKTPDDVKGLKLRTTGDPYHVLCWKLLGVIPTPMPWPDVYMALKTGTVDGQENPVTVIYSAKLFEVQKYLSMTMHAYSAFCVTMNLKKFNGLSADQRKALTEAMAEAISYQRALNREKEKPMLEEMKKTGMVIEENREEARRGRVCEEVRLGDTQ